MEKVEWHTPALPDGTVAELGQHRFTLDELKDFFDFVAPQDNWKNPIDCVRDILLSTEKEKRFLAGIHCAVIWYTGSVPEIRPNDERHNGRVRITAAGYYAAIGA